MAATVAGDIMAIECTGCNLTAVSSSWPGGATEVVSEKLC